MRIHHLMLLCTALAFVNAGRSGQKGAASGANLLPSKGLSSVRVATGIPLENNAPKAAKVTKSNEGLDRVGKHSSVGRSQRSSQSPPSSMNTWETDKNKLSGAGDKGPNARKRLRSSSPEISGPETLPGEAEQALESGSKRQRFTRKPRTSGLQIPNEQGNIDQSSSGQKRKDSESHAMIVGLDKINNHGLVRMGNRQDQDRHHSDPTWYPRKLKPQSPITQKSKGNRRRPDKSKFPLQPIEPRLKLVTFEQDGRQYMSTRPAASTERSRPVSPGAERARSSSKGTASSLARSSDPQEVPAPGIVTTRSKTPNSPSLGAIRSPSLPSPRSSQQNPPNSGLSPPSQLHNPLQQPETRRQRQTTQSSLGQAGEPQSPSSRSHRTPTPPRQAMQQINPAPISMPLPLQETILLRAPSLRSDLLASLQQQQRQGTGQPAPFRIRGPLQIPMTESGVQRTQQTSGQIEPYLDPSAQQLPRTQQTLQRSDSRSQPPRSSMPPTLPQESRPRHELQEASPRFFLPPDLRQQIQQSYRGGAQQSRVPSAQLVEPSRHRLSAGTQPTTPRQQMTGQMELGTQPAPIPGKERSMGLQQIPRQTEGIRLPVQGQSPTVTPPRFQLPLHVQLQLQQTYQQWAQQSAAQRARSADPARQGVVSGTQPTPPQQQTTGRQRYMQPQQISRQTSSMQSSTQAQPPSVARPRQNAAQASPQQPPPMFDNPTANAIMQMAHERGQQRRDPRHPRSGPPTGYPWDEPQGQQQRRQRSRPQEERDDIIMGALGSYTFI